MIFRFVEIFTRRDDVEMRRWSDLMSKTGGERKRKSAMLGEQGRRFRRTDGTSKWLDCVQHNYANVFLIVQRGQCHELLLVVMIGREQHQSTLLSDVRSNMGNYERINKRESPT